MTALIAAFSFVKLHMCKLLQTKSSALKQEWTSNTILLPGSLTDEHHLVTLTKHVMIRTFWIYNCTLSSPFHHCVHACVTPGVYLLQDVTLQGTEQFSITSLLAPSVWLGVVLPVSDLTYANSSPDCAWWVPENVLSQILQLSSITVDSSYFDSVSFNKLQFSANLYYFLCVIVLLLLVLHAIPDSLGLDNLDTWHRC